MPDPDDDQHVYRIDLVTIPAAPGQAPPARRLARLLKHVLRSFGFRCIRAVEVRHGVAQTHQTRAVRPSSQDVAASTQIADDDGETE